MSQFLASGSQIIGASASASVLMNIQEGFPLGWTGLISLQFKRLSRSSPRQFKSINSLALSFLMVQLSHPYMTTEKTIALTRWTFIGKVVSLLFNVAIIKKTLCNPVDYILPGAFVHGIFQAIVLEWGAIAFSTRFCYEGIFQSED